MKLIVRMALVVVFMFVVMVILTAFDLSTQKVHVPSHHHAAHQPLALSPMRSNSDNKGGEEESNGQRQQQQGQGKLEERDDGRDDDSVSISPKDSGIGAQPQHEGIISELKAHISHLLNSHPSHNNNQIVTNALVKAGDNGKGYDVKMNAILERLNFQQGQMKELKENLQYNQEQLLKALTETSNKMSNIHKSVDDMNRRIPMEWALKHYNAEEQSSEINQQSGGNSNESKGNNNDNNNNEEDEVPTPKTSMHIFLQYIQQHLNGLSHDMLLEALGIDPQHEHGVLGWEEEDRVWKSASHYKLFPSQVRLAIFTGYWCMHSLSSRKVIVSSCIDGFLPQSWVFDATSSLRSAINPSKCLDGSKASVDDPVSIADCVFGKNEMEGSVAEGQQWAYEFADELKSVGVLRNKKTGLCIGAEPLAPTDKSSEQPRIVMLPCDGSCGALWTITANATSPSSFAPSRHETEQWMKSKEDELKLSHDNDHEPMAFQYLQNKRKVQGINKPSTGDRIACWVMTNPKNHKTKAVAINSTWGAECDLLLFMTTKHQAGLNTIVLSLGEEENRQFLWRKSVMSWSYMYTHLLDEFDWFVRADDDSFLNIDNMRSMLKEYNATEKHFLGRRLKIDRDDFYSGGPGTIVSQGALKALGDAMKENILDIAANHDTFADDAELAVALKNIQIFPEDSRDEHQLERFTTLSLIDERSTYRAGFPNGFWYFDYSYYSPKEGADGVSRNWVGSHYNTPQEMFMLKGLHEIGCEAKGTHPWEAKYNTHRNHF
eukprot:m.98188 g.98188  ORF g.98188 m.98188 type:complete len:773 (+) comp12513_c0_seq1:188-2506(+)